MANSPMLYQAVGHIRQRYRRRVYRSHSIYCCIEGQGGGGQYAIDCRVNPSAHRRVSLASGRIRQTGRFAQSVIDPALPTCAIPFECINHIRVQTNCGGHFGHWQLGPAALSWRRINHLGPFIGCQVGDFIGINPICGDIFLVHVHWLSSC